MATIQIKSNISFKELLKGVEQMDSSSLEKFVNQVLHIHAKRKAKNLDEKETELFLKINSVIPQEKLQEIDALNKIKEAKGLSDAEQKKLLDLVLEVEVLNAERIKYLGELAVLKNVPLRKLMEDLKMLPLNSADAE